MPTTSNFGWATPADTDLVKDGALAIRTLGNGIDTSLVDLKGGTTGQILSKASNTDLDYTWINNDQGDITGITTGATSGLTGGVTSGTADLKFNTTAKGGLLVGTGSGTVSELGVGTNGQVLTADSTTATGLKWATAGGGGKLLQVVTAASTGYVAITSSNTYADANLSATITPTLNTSKIMVLVTQGFGSYQNTASVKNNAYAKILRGSTTIWQSDASSSNGVTYTSKAYADTSWTTITLHYVDSPASTSALTYKTQWKQADNANDHTLYMNYGTYPSQITLFEIGA